jgi:hypothetical protein
MDRQLHALPQLQLPLTRPHDHGEFFFTCFRQIVKGTVSQDFLLQVFLWIIFSQALENNIGSFQIFFEYSGRNSQVKVHHRYQR